VSVLDSMQKDLEKLVDIFLNDVSVKHRLSGVGVLSEQEAYELGAVGPMLRASGVAYDARKRGYAAYSELDFDVINLRHYRHCSRRGMNPSLRFSRRNPLNPMHA
jgi:ech hydrogenase subunit E